MYVWIWRHLPGPRYARALQSFVLLSLVVGVLFLWVFPWVENALPYTDVTVPGPSTSSSVAPSPGATLPAG